MMLISTSESLRSGNELLTERSRENILAINQLNNARRNSIPDTLVFSRGEKSLGSGLQLVCHRLPRGTFFVLKQEDTR